MSTSKKYALKKQIALEGGAGEEGCVVLDTHNASMFSCNEAAWVLVERLRNATTVEALSTEIERRYAVGQDVALRDVTEFLRQLSVAGLVDEAR